MTNDLKIAASILSADFSNLEKEVRRLEKSGIDVIHVDIMDGHFVPNLSMGTKFVATLRQLTTLPLDVHLMMYNPFDYIEKFIQMGADSISFHFEATEDVQDTINFIRKCGKRAGLVFNPETSFSMATEFFDKCDFMLFMSVHPGFGGQKFIPNTLEKIKFARKACDVRNIKEGGKIDATDKSAPFEIQVDGGINEKTAQMCIENGANYLVSGDYLFSFKDLKEGVEKLRSLWKKK